MSGILTLLSGMLLAAPAGLNPYLPLLLVSVLAHYTERFQLQAPYGFLGQTWFMVLVGLLFLVHIFMDKTFMPGDSWATAPAGRDRRLWVGAFHDLGQMVLGPLSGALLLGAAERVFPPSWPLMGPMLGALLAALAYVGKRALRRRLAGRWEPFGNLLLSAVEEVVVVLVSVAGILLGPSAGS